MIIQHNITAMNANRMLLNNDKHKATLSERLSTGYKVNRAADDAASLSISEKMRRQIRGLTQASSNAQEGISLVQIADGAMNEIHDMLHRGTELSIKAANGTLTDADRACIQQEIVQLIDEIDSITDKTTFNEIRVFQYPEELKDDVVYRGGLPAWVSHTTSPSMDETYTISETYTITDSNTTPPTITTGSANVNHAASHVDFSNFSGSAQQIQELTGNGFHATCCTCERHYSIEFTSGTTSHKEISGMHYIYKIGIDGCKTGSDLIDRIIQGTDNGYPNHHYTKFIKDPNNANNLILYDVRSKDASRNVALTNNNITLQPGQVLSWNSWNLCSDTYNCDPIPTLGWGLFGPGVATAPIQEDYSSVALQIGSESGQHLTVNLPRISSRLLGILYADVSTSAGADDAIQLFKNATEYVSHERSRMGSYQNRLEHTINNLDNVVENTQAAESRIRDTDVALTMLDFANKNILEQAGISVIAQANQNRQAMLTLFQ